MYYTAPVIGREYKMKADTSSASFNVTLVQFWGVTLATVVIVKMMPYSVMPAFGTSLLNMYNPTNTSPYISL